MEREVREQERADVELRVRALDSKVATKVVPVMLSGFPQFFFFKFFSLLVTSINQSQFRKTCS